MKKTLLTLTLASLFTLPSLSFANDAAAPEAKPAAMQSAKPQHDKAFAKALKHSNFMPVLMKAVMKNRAELNLSDEQFAKLKAYKEKNSPAVMAQVKEVVALEKQAKELALKDGDAKEIASLGEKSFKLRHDIMMSKIECRDFVKSVLTAEQYQQLLANYGKKSPKKPA
ncbi:Spy/CpxP family protein refolding chaperone [Thiosulfativibrio zosterae]|uniref:Periplasmic heavy metal sensor n=1 Tax=Thiosulfativibrio zosterae TaxID=2675053 RepID=A0A6F8PMC4_9GAMM|nr:Spy/CpxP family protein refolding chaperone [Thiosulfativibrio zosterae]BBP43261.1 hypothetical protein THMIRHAT_10070 [Thiosulfativibrio zosterae]